jgi:exonuclease III
MLNLPITEGELTSLAKFVNCAPILLCGRIAHTACDQTIKNSEVEIHGYDLVRHDRNRHGGGVAIYIRDIIPYSERKSLILDNIEAICLEIKKPNTKPILISTWYRPPNSNTKWLDRFEFFLQNVDNENIETVITGDLNIDLLPKENESSIKRRLFELLTTYQLQQIIDKPTRITESTKTLLDLIICKTSDLKRP